MILTAAGVLNESPFNEILAPVLGACQGNWCGRRPGRPDRTRTRANHLFGKHGRRYTM